MVCPSYQEYLADADRQLFQILAGFFSILFGMLLAGTIIHFFPQNLSSIEKARQLGIISRSVLDGYPKQLEIQYYILGVVISLLSGLSAFFFLWGALALALFVLTFHKDFIYRNWYWGPWGFFFEEGIYLRCIDELLRGKILYKDIYYHGGPFMGWPQYWLMKLCGASIVLNRYYAYFCYFIGYLIVFKISREIINNKVLIAIGTFLVLYFYYPMFPSFQQSLGRFSVSLLPLYFVYKFCFNRKVRYLFIAGIVLGLALLFSHELGIGSLVAIVVMLAAFAYREGDTIKSFFHNVSIVTIGAFIPLFPVLIYFSFYQSLYCLYEALIKWPRYYIAYGAPFPNIFHILKHSEKGAYDITETLLAHWPIAFYVGSTFYCLALFLRKSFTNRKILLLGITTLGGMIFQRAFGLYDLEKIKNVIYPLIILSVGYLDMMWARTLCLIRNKNINGRKLEILFYAIILLFIVGGLYGFSQQRCFVAKRPHIYLAELKDNESYVPLNLLRAKDIHIPPEYAHKIQAVVEYVAENTEPNEPIYVFPLFPMYYFLTNRPSATKYPASYALLGKYRKQVVKELEEKGINCIIYVKPTPVLGINPETVFPEIVDYIWNNYQPERIFDDTFILKPKG
jgi:hypothetical protein